MDTTTMNTTAPDTGAATDPLIIISPGPAGYTATTYAARAGLTPG
jgi:alkyl hydroperoxide reductase subunit AhpF